MKSTTLYYREGNSDKIYQASIEPKGAGFVVNFAYGRRGSTLATGSKTQLAVDKQTAELIYDKLVREKKAKGYTEGPAGTPYTSMEAKEYSGILPQLLNPIDEGQLDRCVTSPDWVMQEKFDGKRLLLLKEGKAVRGINRKGLFVGIPEPILIEAQRIEGSYLVDGECVGDNYYGFDILSRNSKDLKSAPYRDRMVQLIACIGVGRHPHISAVISFTESTEKRIFIQAAKLDNREGVVFKHGNAPYTAGRPNSGGNQLKCKFYATASFIVGAVNKQRSVLLTLMNAGKPAPAGNVTVPANQEVPRVGEIVEVRYLYAHQQSGSVYQPTLLGRREDIDPTECTFHQLKYKKTPGDEEDSDQ